MYGRCLPYTRDTPNTTRIEGIDQYIAAMAVSEAVWNNPADPMKHPGTVILARGDGTKYQDALIGAPLIHFPHNGPVLLTEPDMLIPAVEQEMMRLNPTGKGSPAQVLLVGSLSPAIDESVRRLGFTACRIDGGDPATTAVMVWQVLGPRRNALLVSGERFEEAVLAGGWAAHMGDPILLTGRDVLPPVTACAIAQTQADVYILGGWQSISPVVEETVRRLTRGFVDRIYGRDAVETAINFTRYSSPTGEFGWDVKDMKGWAFRFSRMDTWYGSIVGNPLSHMGKHAPLLLVPPDCVPPTVSDYILSVNPRHTEPKPPFMHGYLVDIQPGVSYEEQVQLDGLLETVVEHG